MKWWGDLDYEPTSNYERGVQTQEPGEGRRYEPPTPPKKGSALIAVGAIVLIAGIIAAIIPLTWKSMEDISSNWEGSYDQGYYKSYSDGDTAIVTGQITEEFPITMQDDAALYGQGYRFLYEMDHVTDEGAIAKEDFGNEGDRVSLVIELDYVNLDGGYYWIWTVKSKTAPDMYYIVGIALLAVGAVLVGVGAWRRKASERRAPTLRPPTYESYQTRQISRLEREEPTSVVSESPRCAFCGAEMSLGDILCSKCGKSKYDT